MNLFDLYATLSLDKSKYDDGLNNAEKSATNIGSKIASGLATVAKGTAVAIGASATAIGGIVKSSIDAYANFEQLEGGIQTLFGEISTTGDASEEVMRRASNAYKTAGLSANEYMETVTSFSASLMASLDNDGKKAGEQADKAITMMADNANKMGTSMESIQNAFRGFAKQNYTMLDNLSLGYGGTKEEMLRLLADAEKMPEAMGRKFDLNNYSDVIDAIGLVQDKMGITGTTAKEASTTISGSLASMKSAWANLVTELSTGNAVGIDEVLGDFVSSVETFGKNIIPRVQIAIEGVGQLIETLLPVVLDQIPVLMQNTLPKLLQSGANMVTTIVQGIADNIETITSAVVDIVMLFATTIIQNLPTILEAGMKILTGVAQGIAEALPELMPTIIDVILQIVEILTNPDNLMPLLQASLQIITAIGMGLIQALPVLVARVPEIIVTLINTLTSFDKDVIDTGIELLEQLIIGLLKAIPQLIVGVGKIAIALVQAFLELRQKFIDVGSNIVAGIKKGISDAWGKVVDWIIDQCSKLVDKVKSFFGINSPSKVFAGIGGYLAEGLGVGWEDSIGDVKKNITKDLDFSAEGFGITSEVNGSAGANGSVFNQIINVNQEIATADELARAIRIESRYGLMEGVALG